MNGCTHSRKSVIKRWTDKDRNTLCVIQRCRICDSWWRNEYALAIDPKKGFDIKVTPLKKSQES